MLKDNLTSTIEGNKIENLVGKMEIMQNKDGSQSNDLRIKEMHFGVFCNYKYTGFIYSRLDGTRLFMEKYFEDGVAISSDDSRDIRKSVKDTARYDRILALQSRHVSCSSDDDDYYARSIEEFPLNKTVVYINRESDTSRLYITSTPDRIVVDAVKEEQNGLFSFYMNIGMSRTKIFDGTDLKSDNDLVDRILPFWEELDAGTVNAIRIQYFNEDKVQFSDRTISVDIESYTERLHKKSFMEDHFTDEGNGVPCYDLYVAGEVSGQLCEACEWMSTYDVELAFKEYLKLK